MQKGPDIIFYYFLKLKFNSYMEFDLFMHAEFSHRCFYIEYIEKNEYFLNMQSRCANNIKFN